MKTLTKILITNVAAGVFLLGTSLDVTAGTGDTASMAVSATVTGSCRFTAVNPLVFGTLDPVSGANTTKTATFSLWCTKDNSGGGGSALVTYNLGANANSGIRHLVSPSAASQTPIAYSWSTDHDIVVARGKSNPDTITVTSTILGTDYIDAEKAADYADTVVLTVTP